MIRKLTATGFSALALAGVVGTGAAFAAPNHTAKPAAVSHESSSYDRSRDATSADRSNDGSVDSVSVDSYSVDG